MINGIEFIGYLGLFQTKWSTKALITKYKFVLCLLIAEKLRIFEGLLVNMLCA